MAFERENTTVAAEEILQAMAGGQAVHLIRCRIAGRLDLNRFIADGNDYHIDGLLSQDGETAIVRLPQSIQFNACTFDEDVLFAGPWEQAERLHVVFAEEVRFNSSVFAGQTRFAGARFEKSAGFDGCMFSQVCSFQHAVFSDRVMFRTATFEGYGLFSSAVFAADTRFSNATFGRGANFAKVRFDNRCDFAGVFARSKAIPIYEGVCFSRKRFGDDESFWRFIKQACQEAGYYQQAGECFFAERCGYFWRKFRGPAYERLSAVQRAVRWLAGVRLLPEFVFGRLLFGYGERPIRVLVAAAIVILVCAVFYTAAADQLVFEAGTGHTQADFFDGLYYSTITFTTLGLGEIYPRADGLVRLVTMLESLCGLFLMSLFVVCLSKRFSRG